MIKTIAIIILSVTFFGVLFFILVRNALKRKLDILVEEEKKRKKKQNNTKMCPRRKHLGNKGLKDYTVWDGLIQGILQGTQRCQKGVSQPGVGYTVTQMREVTSISVFAIPALPV